MIQKELPHDLSDEEFSEITIETHLHDSIIAKKITDNYPLSLKKDVDYFYTWRLALYWFNYGCIQDGINVINNCWIWISLNPYQPKAWC